MQINWYFLFYNALKTHCVEDEWWCDEIIYAAFAFLHFFSNTSWVFGLWCCCTRKGWCVIFFFRYCCERKHETNDNAAEDVFLIQPTKLELKPFFHPQKVQIRKNILTASSFHTEDVSMKKLEDNLSLAIPRIFSMIFSSLRFTEIPSANIRRTFYVCWYLFWNIHSKSSE